MDYKFQRKRLNKIPESKILEKLEKAAKYFNYTEFAQGKFGNVTGMSATTVIRHFGNWRKALVALRKHLEQKGLNLAQRSYITNRPIWSEKEMFDEMERIWQMVGQRPSCAEWEMSKPRISYDTYHRRFGSWTNACLKFIEYKMGTTILVDDDININVGKSQQFGTKNNNGTISNRAIPLKTRLKVLDRDAYRCVLCGCSPATERGVQLQIDHKIPFSKGGRSTIDNLQTLCRDCNLGKSDEVYKR